MRWRWRVQVNTVPMAAHVQVARIAHTAANAAFGTLARTQPIWHMLPPMLLAQLLRTWRYGCLCYLCLPMRIVARMAHMVHHGSSELLAVSAHVVHAIPLARRAAWNARPAACGLSFPRKFCQSDERAVKMDLLESQLPDLILCQM